MNHLLASASLATCLLVFPTAAHCQGERSVGLRTTAPKSARIPETTDMDPVTVGRITMSEFARCTIDGNRRGVEDVLQLPIDGPWQEAAGKLVDSDCLDGGELRFKATVMRGALFTELWRLRVRAEARGRTVKAWPTPIDFKPVSPSADVSTRQHLAALAFADCVVAADRSAASELLVAPTASDRQAAAYAAIQAKLGPCLTEGSTIKLSKAILERALAEVLVRSVALSKPAASAK